MPCHLRLTPDDVLDLNHSVLVLGGTGTAKSTATAAAICRAQLADPTVGFLFLIAHPEALTHVLSSIHDARRDHDLVLWGVQSGYGVEQLVHIVMQALEIRDRLEGGETDDRYFMTAMQGAVRSTLQLTLLAQYPPSIYSIHRVLTSISTPGAPRRKGTSSFYDQLLILLPNSITLLRYEDARHGDETVCCHLAVIPSTSCVLREPLRWRSTASLYRLSM